MSNFLKLFFFSVYMVCLCLAGDLPPYFPRCHIDDPELQKCLLQATETIRPYIKKGVPDLNIPPMEPLVIPEISMQQETNTLNYKLKLVNATLRGIGDYYEFKKFRYDPKTFMFHITAVVKELSIVSNYDVDGKLLIVPIKGTGTMRIKLGPSTESIIIRGELVKRHGEDYYNIKDIKAEINLSDSNQKFNFSFNGNEELSRTANKIIDDNAAEMIKEVTPALEDVAARLLSIMMKGICSKVPFKKLLPPTH